jgi:hypothetical protein
MSRLRRPFLYDRCIFVTVDLLEFRDNLLSMDFERLAPSLSRMQRKQGFLLTAWVFLLNPVRHGLAGWRLAGWRMPPFGMYAIMARRGPVSKVQLHSSPITKRSQVWTAGPALPTVVRGAIKSNLVGAAVHVHNPQRCLRG